MRISTTDPMTLNDMTDKVIAAGMQAELANLARSLRVPLMLGGSCGDRALEVFENAGGVRMGSRISVALRVLGSQVARFGAGSGQHEFEAGD
jgi:CO dehydrogenase/acetyl-CoA synthase delta subunit